MDESVTLAHICACIEIGDYESDSEHLDRHMIPEGFNYDDMARAVVEGTCFERSIERSRWLFCGRVPRLRAHPRFRGRWLHVDVQYEQGSAVAVVTAYRPLVAMWETETRRRVGA